MKNKKLILTVTIIALVFSFSLTAFAISEQRDIKVTYDNIKLMVDGKLFTPKDANGNVAEPFIYNGTTYVPIRAVSEALNKKVGWDGATNTITIGAQTTTYLDTMNTYQSSTDNGLTLNKAIGEITIQGKTYDCGVLFEQHAEIGAKNITTESSYSLNGEYLEFYATLLVTAKNYDDPSIIKIYGDNSLLYASPGIVMATKPIDISINVKDVDMLKIEIFTPTPHINGKVDSTICFAEARLTK